MLRRAFLKSMGCSAALTLAAPASVFASPPAIITARQHRFRLTVTGDDTKRAMAFARHVDRLTAGRMHVTLARRPVDHRNAFLPADDEMRLGTLHAAVAHHPAFAYVAGLPGALGVPYPLLSHWLEDDARDLWHDLQAAHGVTCMLTGPSLRSPSLLSAKPIINWSSISGRTLCADGLSRDVARGLGAVLVVNVNAAMIQTDSECLAAPGFPYRATPALQRIESPRGITMQRKTWMRLDNGLQAALIIAAKAQSRATCTRNRPRPASVLPSEINVAIERVSEAVVADIAGHDRISQRINAAYFAVHSRCIAEI